MNKELAKTLTTALVQFIDEQRPEGTMCCSNTDCENIRAALEEGEYDCVEAFIQKKLLRLTEFEKCMLDFAKARDEYEFDSTKVIELNNKVIKLTKSYSKKLLDLAKKETLSDLPRWERDDSIEAEQYITVGKNGERFHYKGHSLLISDLVKLPGFKEEK